MDFSLDSESPIVDACLRQGVDYETACSLLQQVSSEKPGPPAPHASLKEVEAYVALDPIDPRRWQMLARKHVWAERYQGADRAYQRLLELVPSWVERHAYDRQKLGPHSCHQW